MQLFQKKTRFTNLTPGLLSSHAESGEPKDIGGTTELMKHCRKNVPLDGSGAEQCLKSIKTNSNVRKVDRRELPRIQTDEEMQREDFCLINNTSDQEVR